MKLVDVPKTLMRRWYLTLAGLLATAALCLAAFMLVPPTQRVEATILLLPPTSAVGRGGNPYLGLGGLTQANDVLSRALSAQSTRKAIEQAWPSATYTAEPDFASDGPILVVTVDDPSSAAALAVTDQLLKTASSTLDTLQSGLGVRDTSRIRSAVLTRDNEPLVVRSDQLRALVAAGGVGFAGTVLVVAMIDGLAGSRRKKTLTRSDDVPAPEDGVGVADPVDFAWGAWPEERSDTEWSSQGSSATKPQRKEKVDIP